jgi:precorrin-6A/cobalt-precorrin-6A reductase
MVLGGTAEARALAEALAARDGVAVLTSLAGAVLRPVLPAGEVRVGGFGGVEGLAASLRTWQPDVLVDATHPFAATMTAHAVSAAALTSTPLLVLRRPPWTPSPGDRWTMASDIAATAGLVRALPPGCVFLTTGRRDLGAFAEDSDHDYLVRSVDPPTGPRPPRTRLLHDRGPYTVEGELDILRVHHVDTLVTRNSGGDLTSAKLTAARQLGLPAVLIDRPPLPDGVQALPDVDTVLARLGL